MIYKTFNIQAVAIEGFPLESTPGILTALGEQPCEYRWSSRFIFMDPHEAIAHLEKFRKKWKQKVRGKWITHVEQPTGTQYIGMVGEVRADALTKSQDSDTWSMRFPRFECWRGFAVGEKL